jgi:PST family polysaccharide transporter
MLARRIHGFRFQTLSLGLLGLHTVLAIALLGLALVAPLAAAIVSPVVAGATGLFGLRVVLVKIGPEGRLASRFARFYAAIRWPIPETP